MITFTLMTNVKINRLRRTGVSRQPKLEPAYFETTRSEVWSHAKQRAAADRQEKKTSFFLPASDRQAGRPHKSDVSRMGAKLRQNKTSEKPNARNQQRQTTRANKSGGLTAKHEYPDASRQARNKERENDVGSEQQILQNKQSPANNKRELSSG